MANPFPCVQREEEKSKVFSKWEERLLALSLTKGK
jgi:hypothetical protein